MMTEQNPAPPRVDRGDLGKFETEVADLVIYLVNEQGIRYKYLDAEHLVLYPPDGLSRPFKIAAKRPGPEQVEFIRRQFMKRHGVPGPDGVVPGTKAEPVETVTLSGVELSAETLEAPQIAPLVPGARQAVLDLAAAMGLTLGGVPEDDYLAVVEEKDTCQAEVVRLGTLVMDLQTRIRELEGECEQWSETHSALMAQRDRLLEKVRAAHAELEGAL